MEPKGASLEIYILRHFCNDLNLVWHNGNGQPSLTMDGQASFTMVRHHWQWKQSIAAVIAVYIFCTNFSFTKSPHKNLLRVLVRDRTVDPLWQRCFPGAVYVSLCHSNTIEDPLRIYLEVFWTPLSKSSRPSQTTVSTTCPREMTVFVSFGLDTCLLQHAPATVFMGLSPCEASVCNCKDPDREPITAQRCMTMPHQTMVARAARFGQKGDAALSDTAGEHCRGVKGSYQKERGRRLISGHKRPVVIVISVRAADAAAQGCTPVAASLPRQTVPQQSQPGGRKERGTVSSKAFCDGWGKPATMKH